ncbi:hypothetical protein [Streptomyces sp. NPDC001833]|uniref:hypothetical protein n=1 Tax=Streptomyces sp. NPDC001833 TaxID=3154658 RepID=UPI003331A9D1
MKYEMSSGDPSFTIENDASAAVRGRSNDAVSSFAPVCVTVIVGWVPGSVARILIHMAARTPPSRLVTRRPYEATKPAEFAKTVRTVGVQGADQRLAGAHGGLVLLL